MLPYRAQPFLYAHAVGHLAYLLELVNANDNPLPPAPGYGFRKLENLLWRVYFRIDAQIQCELRVRLGRHTDFGVSLAMKSIAFSIHNSALEAVCFRTTSARVL